MRLSLCLLVCAIFWSACDGGKKETAVSLDTPTEVRAESQATPDRFDASFKDGITAAIFQDYLHLRTAFVRSDGDEARAAAQELTERLPPTHDEARTAAQAIVEASDLEQQRTAFAELTDALEPLFDLGSARWKRFGTPTSATRC